MPVVRRSIEDYSLRPAWDPLDGDHEFLEGTTLRARWSRWVPGPITAALLGRSVGARLNGLKRHARGARATRSRGFCIRT